MPPTRRSYLRIVDRIGLRKTAALDVAGECQRGEFHSSVRAYLPMQDQQRAWSHRRSTLPWQPSYQLVSLHNPLAASRSERTEESQQRKKWNAKRIQQNAHEGQFLLGSTDLPISV